MSDIKPEWVDALVRLFGPGVGDRETYAAAIAEVAPLIRADTKEAWEAQCRQWLNNAATEHEAEIAVLRDKIEEMRVGWDADVDFSNRMLVERDAARAEVEVLQDALEEVVSQACYAYDADTGAHLDSMALTAYAHGMRVLAEQGRITIEHEAGRRVIGRWIEEEGL